MLRCAVLFIELRYLKGVQPARLDLLYPLEVTLALRAALTTFEREKPGFASCPDALLHGVETRTRYVLEQRVGNRKGEVTC